MPLSATYVINDGASEDEPKEHAALLSVDRIYDRYIPNIEMAWNS